MLSFLTKGSGGHTFDSPEGQGSLPCFPPFSVFPSNIGVWAPINTDQTNKTRSVSAVSAVYRAEHKTGDGVPVVVQWVKDPKLSL